jgi:hypothetical protein
MDLTGFDVEAADGSIGKVDEATQEVGESYLVVDTGVWIFGKKVLLPAGLAASESIGTTRRSGSIGRKTRSSKRRSSTRTRIRKPTTGLRSRATTARGTRRTRTESRRPTKGEAEHGKRAMERLASRSVTVR